MRSSAVLFAALAAVATGWACQPASLPETYGPVDLVVAATTDIHGYVRGWDYYANAPDTVRGLARVATIIDSLRRVSPTFPVVVDAGDIIQGTPLAYVAARVDTTMRNPVIAAMNAIQYDAAAVGNHEFNYGLGTLDRADPRSRVSAARHQRGSAERQASLPPVGCVDAEGDQDRHRGRDDARIHGLGPRQPDRACAASTTSCPTFVPPLKRRATPARPSSSSSRTPG